MALVHWDGERWKPMTFKGAFHGADVYLCCPGPSLATLDPSLLQKPGIVTIAVNSAYPKVRPTIWAGTDHPTCFDQNFLWEPFIKVLRMCWRDQWVFGKPIKECPGVYFADVDDKSHALEMWDRQTDNLALVAPVRNSFEAALHLALWIGARRIHLVGCDFGGGKDYHDDRQLTDHQRVNNQRLYHQLARRLIHHRVEGALRKIELISCTEGSPINSIMPHVPLDDAIAASVARVPVGWSPTLDARDAMKCRWQGEVKAEQGVVVGVIEGHAWMLDWWYENFRKHNPSLAVVFADFGLSKSNQDWCDAHGGRIVVSCPDTVEGWFRKPFAILQAPYKKILWLDLDTEIRKPLTPFFDAITGDNLLICGVDEVLGPHYGTSHDHGWFLMLPEVKVDMCSGMVGVMRGNPHIQEWAANSVPPREFNYKGDHEILGVGIHRRDPKLHRVKGTEYTLARFPASDDPCVLHHAGIPAKERLRARLFGGGQAPASGAPLMLAEETWRLQELVKELAGRADPIRILEIGVAEGATGSAMMQAAIGVGRRFLYVGVDPMTWKRPSFAPSFAQGGDVHLVPKPSSLAVPDVTALSEVFDLVLIDGCHCEKCCRFDWEHYGPLVGEGGYLAFHDTATPTDTHSRQPGNNHVGHGVREVYLPALKTEGWEDAGHVGEWGLGRKYGLGLLRRVSPSAAAAALAASIPCRT